MLWYTWHVYIFDLQSGKIKQYWAEVYNPSGFRLSWASSAETSKQLHQSHRSVSRLSIWDLDVKICLIWYDLLFLPVSQAFPLGSGHFWVILVSRAHLLHPNSGDFFSYLPTIFGFPSFVCVHNEWMFYKWNLLTTQWKRMSIQRIKGKNRKTGI